MAEALFPTDYTKDESASTRAGYPIYRSTADGCGAWISDLGTSLEVNYSNGKSDRIWIEEEEPQTFNEETITLTLPRITVIDLELATLGVIFAHREEAADPKTNETRRAICNGTVEKWEAIRAEVHRQFMEQDKPLLQKWGCD